MPRLTTDATPNTGRHRPPRRLATTASRRRTKAARDASARRAPTHRCPLSHLAKRRGADLGAVGTGGGGHLADRVNAFWHLEFRQPQCTPVAQFSLADAEGAPRFYKR